MAENPATPGSPPSARHDEPSERDRRLLEALGDPVALRILSALSRGERVGHDLVVETNLPQSSIYRKLRDLQQGGLVYVTRLAFTSEGRKVEVFASRIRAVSVEFSGGLARVRVRPREDSADRIGDLWSQVRAR